MILFFFIIINEKFFKNVNNLYIIHINYHVQKHHGHNQNYDHL